MSGRHRQSRPLIRTVKRSWWHPRGKALVCAYPPCTFLARGGYEIRDDVRGLLWPFCSAEHGAKGIPL